MPAVPIIGRHAELSAVDEFFDGTGEARALVMEGEAGIGKSVLWRAAIERGRARDLLALSTHPSASEAKLPLVGVSDLLAGIDDWVFADLPPPQRRALDVALLRDDPEGQAPDPRLLAAAFLSVLRELANRGPVVIAIDDIQWLDTSSERVLEFALRRMTDEPVLLLAAERLEAGSSSSALASALPPDRVRRLRLAGLSLSALHHILKGHLGHVFPRRLLAQIEHTSAGNPFFALELGRAIMGDASGSRAEPLALPGSLLELVQKRLRRLPASCRDELLAAAAASQPTVELLDRAALSPAEDAGLIHVDSRGRVRFDHPLIASGVYGAARPSRRRAAHARLAEQVATEEERALHLALATPGPDESVARSLEDAARSATRRGAPAAAAELLELALDATPAHAPESDTRPVELARQLNLAGDFRRSAELLEQLVEQLRSGDLRARAYLLLSDVEYWTKGAAAACARAARAAEAAEGPLLRARAHAVLGISAIHDVRTSAAEADKALRLLSGREHEDPETLSLALCTRARGNLFMGLGYDADAVDRAVAVEAASPPADGQDRASFKQGQLLKYVDDLEGSRRLLEASLQAALAEGDQGSLPNILVNLTVTECWAGRWETAAAHAERAVEEAEQLGVFPQGALAYKAYVACHRGEDALASAVLAEGDPVEPVVTAFFRYSVGLAQLGRADHEAADASLVLAMELLDQIGFAEPAILRFHGDAIEAAHAVGDVERAEGWLRPFEEQAERVPIPWSRAVSARCRALVHAANGDLDAAEAALERALTAHDECPVPFERARTLLVSGELHRRLNRRRLAKEVLTESRELFERLGSPPWAERADEELARLGLRRRAGNELTPTEGQIAVLAAKGLTNRQIAERVFVSPKTVEANLARAYRKLGIRSRAELGRTMAEREVSRI